MKIGILGGTFNPVHNGHIKMAETVLCKLNLDKIMFLPNSIPPHKELKGFATNNQRLDMLRLATKNNKKFFISDYELNKGGKSYSIDTLNHFLKDDNEYVFIIGADSFYEILTWKDGEKLIKLCRFAVFSREYNDKVLKDEIDLFNKKYKADFVLVDMENIDISSTVIRQNIIEGKNISDLVPESVEKYIKENNLYTKKED
ncbi:MAG: nicotinate-nucleotide adenylyltransferase [Ruminococcaceae bacterium]|nr:nicotinate-nucleotide adenylyltransferase [Oscillospiraceae bacterium]